MSVDLHTEDRLVYQFFPVTSNYISFKIRAANDAHIILTANPYESRPCYEIFFGGWENKRSIVRKNLEKPNVVEANTPGILSAYEYRGFWIRWENCVITAGVEGDHNPTLLYHDPYLFPVRYFGVCTGWGASGHWIINHAAIAPPLLPANYPSCGQQPQFNPHYPQTSTCQPVANMPRWVYCADGSLPPGAVVGGHDVNGETVYVARAFHKGAHLPGKFVSSHKVTYVAWGGEEIAKSIYEILCDCNPRWMSATGNCLPYGAFICGNTEDGESLYVGRAYHEGSLTPGKVQHSHGVCYIPFAGAEVAKTQYEVLLV